jgi:putative transposase
MKRPQLETGNFYHVYNRSVEKRVIFQRPADNLRFIEGMGEFNDRNAVNLRFRHTLKQSPNHSPNKDRIFVKKKIPLVKIHAFCLMPNHFHMLIEQIAENGISLFMQKLGIGYAMYFNTVNKRVGPLFQGRFKAKLIAEESYLTHLLRYIHLNPVELVEPHWKEGGIKNWKKARHFINSYPWSSHAEYSGQKTNFSKTITTEFLHTPLDGPKGYREFLASWLSTDVEKIHDIMLD